MSLALAGAHAAVLWAMAGPAQAQGAAPSAAPPYRLPADPQTVILRWDSLGGMSPKPGSDGPALLVLASGAFSALPHPGKAARRTGQLDAQGLQGLLAEILVRHRFTSISAAAILVRIQEISQRSGRLFAVMDGGETRIEVQLPQVSHRLAFPALHAAYRLFPEIEDLQRLHAIQQRLLMLANTAR